MMLRLIDAVDYWKSKGILIDFIPCIIFHLAGISALISSHHIIFPPDDLY